MNESQNRFQQVMNLGHTAAWDQDWQTAADHYREALDITPDDPKALNSLGLALYELGLYDQSLENYFKAADISPDDSIPQEKISQLYELLGETKKIVEPSLRAGELYLSDGNIAKAVECLARVTRTNPENLPAHSRLALIYERTGHKNQAVTEYLVVASLLQRRGEEENTRQAINRALEIIPESKEAGQALSLIESGELLPKPVASKLDTSQLTQDVETPVEKERISREELSGLDPVAEACQVALATLANFVLERDFNAQTSAYQDPAQNLEEIMRGVTGGVFISQGDPKEVFAHLEPAVTYQSQGLENEAADELERAIEAGLDHPSAYYDLGLIRSRGDRLESAIRYLRRSTDSADYALASQILLGRTQRFMGRLNEAATSYLEALRLADAQVIQDEHANDLRQMYDAIIEAEAKQSDPDIKNNLCDTIEDILSRPDWRESLARVRNGFQINLEGAPPIPVGEILSNPKGDQIVNSVRKINDYARSGYMRSAMEEAYFALQFAPTYLPLHTNMGELLIQQNHIPEAIAKFRTIAHTYRTRGEMQHAMQILRRIIRAAPMDLIARKELIELLQEKGQINDAIQESIRLADVYYNLADLSRAREAYNHAFKLVQSSDVNHELSVNILHYIADIELQSLDWKQALQIYEQIRAIKPDDFQAAEKMIELNLRFGKESDAEFELDNYLSLMEIKGDSQSGLDYLDKIIGENPTRILLRRKKAEIYQRQGRLEEVIQELDVVGEDLLKSGDREGAIQVIEAILEFDPTNKSDYETLLSQLKGEE
jgi:tetratricopeptide (TPR) repeat protein